MGLRGEPPAPPVAGQARLSAEGRIDFTSGNTATGSVVKSENRDDDETCNEGEGKPRQKGGVKIPRMKLASIPVVANPKVEAVLLKMHRPTAEVVYDTKVPTRDMQDSDRENEP